MIAVQVRWNDAQGQSGWTSVGEIEHRPDSIGSVGWLVRHDEAGVTVCQSFNDSDRIADTLFVPAAYVVEVRELRIAALLEGETEPEPPSRRDAVELIASRLVEEHRVGPETARVYAHSAVAALESEQA